MVRCDGCAMTGDGVAVADAVRRRTPWQPRTAAWRPQVAVAPGRPTPTVRRLLNERGSLTARLERLGAVHVHVLREAWQRPGADEGVALGLAVGRHAWLREVVLDCEGGPTIYARSVVPGRMLGPLARLPRLGERPLGRLLFSAADVQRGPLAVARLRGDEPLAGRLRGHGLPNPKGGWARRSTLSVAGRRLLVTEVFFPEGVEGEQRGAQRRAIGPGAGP